MDALQNISDARRLAIAPGDVIVITFPSKVPNDQVDRMRGQLRERLFPDNQVLVLEGGATIQNVSMDKRIAAMDEKLDRLIQACGIDQVEADQVPRS